MFAPILHALLWTVATSAADPNQARDEAAAEASGLREERSLTQSPGPLAVYVKEKDAWNAPVLQVAGRFAEVGREIFGDDLPLVRLFLVSDRGDLESFTRATLGRAREQGTGTFHLAVICLKCERRPVGKPETTAVVLHECGHAWLNTYLRDHYRLDYLSPAIRRPFLDEGIADFIANRWDADFLARRRTWMSTEKVARGVPPPALEDLNTYAPFYEQGDRNVHYWFSALLVERMLGSPTGAPRRILKYLDEMGSGASPEEAWERATGKSIRTEYDALVAELWGRRK